jgi:protein tyrosine phosphatase (PTP) superfamily phosphohydrolase (DUF442 family)
VTAPPRTLSAVAAVLLGAALVGVAACRGGRVAEPAARPGNSDAHAEAARRVHQYEVLSPTIVRGAQPEGDAAFAALAAAGVKTLVSVDGARPDVEAARRHGLRYVHVPIGYDGIPAEKATLLTKAFTTMPGPFFVHCHHGKHRGPAACAIGRIVVDGATVEETLVEMKAAGTDPKYRGLYAAPGEYRRPDAEALAAAGPLPEAAPVPALAQAMVEADATWARLEEVRTAGWKASAEHPDVDPAHEALIFAEGFREMARHSDAATRPAEFRALLERTEKAGWDLSRALRPESRDPKAAQAAHETIKTSCVACHAQFRDNR